MDAADFVNLMGSTPLLAGIYAAIAVGMSIIYGVMKIVNLAHAGFLMLGAYYVLELHERLNIDPLVGSVLAFPAFLLAGMLVHWTLVKRIPVSDQPTLASLLLMFGLWLVLQNIGYLIWGGSDRSILTSRTLSSMHLGPITISTVRVMVFIPAVCSLGLLEVVLRKTWYGRAVRALMQNRYAGRLAGIPVEKMARLTLDRKSTRLNSSHLVISYAVFCLKHTDAVSGLNPAPAGHAPAHSQTVLPGWYRGVRDVRGAPAAPSASA